MPHSFVDRKLADRLVDKMTTALIVEDTKIIRTTLRWQLEELGLEVLEAVNGEEGVLMAEAHHPRLIIMDVELPDQSGISVTRVIRNSQVESAKDNKSKILLFTGSALEQPEDIELFDGKLDKPVKKDEFETVLKEIGIL